MLFSWEFRPASMLYVLVGQTAQRQDDGSFSVPDTGVFSKLTWLFSI